MSIVDILTAIGASGLSTVVLGAVLNKRQNKAIAVAAERKSDTDYVGNMLANGDKLTKQALDDRKRAFDDRDRILAELAEARAECKGQRKAKQDWRAKHEESVAKIHELELSVKDFETKLAEAEWYKCEVNGCMKRVPPRKRGNGENDERGN